MFGKYFYKTQFLSIITLSFLSGAAIEYFMINLNIGSTNFYEVYKKNQIKKLAEYKSLESPYVRK